MIAQLWFSRFLCVRSQSCHFLKRHLGHHPVRVRLIFNYVSAFRLLSNWSTPTLNVEFCPLLTYTVSQFFVLLHWNAELVKPRNSKWSYYWSQNGNWLQTQLSMKVVNDKDLHICLTQYQISFKGPGSVSPLNGRRIFLMISSHSVIGKSNLLPFGLKLHLIHKSSYLILLLCCPSYKWLTIQNYLK